jgi:hypothetical protein
MVTLTVLLQPQAGQSNPTFTKLTIVSNSVVALNAMIKIRGSSATITDALVILGSKGSAPGQLVDSQTLK